MEKKKLTTEQWIKRAKEKHGDRYDYSKTEYFGRHKSLKIICHVHGEFEQPADSHIKGRGCLECSGFKPLTNEIFIKEAKEKHGDKYDYSKTQYTTTREKVIIICKEHGEFKQRPNAHLSAGCGCIKCSGRYLDKSEFVKKVNKIYDNKYDYSLTDLTQSPIQVICPVHGIFKVSKSSHMNSIRQGCQLCNEPKGESIIRIWLKEKGIKFERQKKFNGCENKKKLPFDFYIPSLNMCIEFDGKQHFQPIDYFGGHPTYLRTKNCDSIKNNFCEANNIQLLRVKYNENILDKLQQKIKPIV